MARITDPDVLALAASDETAWEGFTDGDVIFQRDCPNCERGLLYAPVRFCGACSGTGQLTRTVERAGVSQS